MRRNAGITYPVAFVSARQKAIWRYATKKNSIRGYLRVMEPFRRRGAARN
jgi:hypothetical protein